MYVNKGDDKIKQLHADIGRTIPQEDLKLGQKMKDGDVVKKKKNKSALQRSKESSAETEELIKKAKEKKYPEVPSKEELPKMVDLKKKKKKKKKKSFNKRVSDEPVNVAKGGKIKKYSYRRGGMTTLRKPKRR